ncbi:PH domain-containing protein [Rhodococcus sp. X156]|uniref:PH domain-containing protein n=1 Tax=Rhodococcus sp. X156 TaxID=2499145 RepID=UPI0013E3080B|nr:PH domain-containing protein [Rhodococcus sp. X156]
MSDYGATTQAWGPKPAALIYAAVGGAVLAVVAVAADEPAGRLLIGLAAAGLLLTALAGARSRPRLAVDAGGLTVRGPWGARRVGWTQLRGCEVVQHHRLGRRVGVLELTVQQDDRESLLLLTKAELGTDPEDVLWVVQGFRPDRFGADGSGGDGPGA